MEWVDFFFSPVAYNENLKMISLAILFELEQDLLILSKKRLEENNVNDWLFNCMFKDKQEEMTLLFPHRFHTLKEVFEKIDRVILLKKYLRDEWYNQEYECYEAHKSKQNLYYGYWSFEAGAIAKILKIDDSSLKDVPYYPYDLVHYKND